MFSLRNKKTYPRSIVKWGYQSLSLQTVFAYVYILGHWRLINNIVMVLTILYTEHGQDRQNVWQCLTSHTAFMIQQPNLSLRRLLEQMFIRLSASDNLEKTLLAERNYDLYLTCSFFLKSIGQSFPGRLVPVLSWVKISTYLIPLTQFSVG